jgi:cyclopropane fatty-acyl-phospholipid synthase-like methyltransferase
MYNPSNYSGFLQACQRVQQSKSITTQEELIQLRQENSLLLARYRYHIHAIDASSQGIHKLERYARLHDLHTITYSVTDVREVQLAPNFYDAIVAVTILDHLTEKEGKKVAESIIDALKPDGFVFQAFTTPKEEIPPIHLQKNLALCVSPSRKRESVHYLFHGTS